MSFGRPSRIFADRDIIVTAFDYLKECLEPAVYFERLAEEMGQITVGDEESTASMSSNVVFVPGIGWQLKSHQFNPGNVHELAVAAPGVITKASGALLTASLVDEKAVNKPATGTGLGSGLQAYATTTPMLTKLKAEGSSWGSSLSGPDTPEMDQDPEKLDWWAATRDVHLPTEGILVRLTIPGGSVDLFSAVACIGFTGPAGSSKTHRGNGRYQLKLYADGRATLHESGVAPGSSTTRLRIRKKFRWVEEGRAVGGNHWIRIQSDAFDDGTGAYKGRTITFFCNHIAEGGNNAIRGILELAIGSLRASSGLGVPIYKVPRFDDTAVVEPDVARIGIARQIRALAQISKDTFPTSGVLYDGSWSIDFWPSDTKDFQIEWYANRPAGTNITLRVFNAEDGSELTVTPTLSDIYGGVATFTPVPKVRQYRCLFEFTSDGERTPTLKSFVVYRGAVTERPDVDPLVLDPDRGGLPEAVVTGLTIQGPTHESADETAHVAFEDLVNRYPELRQVAEWPIHIETTTDGVGGRSTLFRGYAMGSDFLSRSAPDGATYPINRQSGSMPCVGYWARFASALMPRRFSWTERTTNRPMKVTDIIVKLLDVAGVPLDEIDIPDLPIRLSGLRGEDDLTDSPGNTVLDRLTQLAADYLGGIIYRDHNAGTNGLVRLKRPPGLPLYPLVKFMEGHPGDGKLPHSALAWGETISGLQTIVHTYIRSGTFSTNWEHPEGNAVAVYGAANPAQSGESSPSQLTQCLVNVKSANFLGLATTHPKYPRPGATHPSFTGRFMPIKVFDQTLATQEIVDWVCTITYLSACFAKRIVRFVAPLVLVEDVRDTLQTKPRPLQAGDAVIVTEDGEEKLGIVRSCDMFLDDAGNQWASMTVVQSEVIDKYGWHSDADMRTRLTQRAAQRMFGLTGRSPQGTAGQRSSIVNASAWMGLPEITGEKIQDLDPDSATFGDLLYVMDLIGLAP